MQLRHDVSLNRHGCLNGRMGIVAHNFKVFELVIEDRVRTALDQVIETMLKTGLDLQTKYKETSRGGLAVSVVEC